MQTLTLQTTIMRQITILAQQIGPHFLTSDALEIFIGRAMQCRQQQTPLLHRRVNEAHNRVAEASAPLHKQLAFIHIRLGQWVADPILIRTAILILNDRRWNRNLQNRNLQRAHLESAQQVVLHACNVSDKQFVADKRFYLVDTLKSLVLHDALKLFLNRHIKLNLTIELIKTRLQLLNFFARINFIFFVFFCRTCLCSGICICRLPLVIMAI
mmetsp:Transcript_42368/g.69854  ORF Transcript_42368/g.69854 Transcript_42368/m.69854 type:complete len:213 (-) Transcript_42368:1318-1956(-)